MGGRKLSRRTILRGLGGTAIALPALDIMLNDHGDAIAGTGDIPCRFLVAFNGQALGCDNDPLRNLYVPDNPGPGYDLKAATQPLGDVGVQDEVTLVSGLRIPYNDGNGIPAGGWDTDFHIQALGPLISGMRNNASDDYGVNGPTADQIVAEAIGQDTTFKSLQYQVQAAWYLSGGSAPYGRDLISYRDDGNGGALPNPGQISPKAAFDALFTGFVPPDPAEAEAKAYELAKRKSVIDLVRGDFERLQPRLGRADDIRVDQHLSFIRDLETRLDAVPPEATETCKMLADFGADPSIGGDNDAANGDGFDVNKGYSDEETRARLFADLITVAFACDLTRSVALLYTMAQSHMNIHPIAGHPYDQHELGHSGLGTVEMTKVLAWHVNLFAELVRKLRDTPEGAGSILDNSALVLLHEAGHGWDPGAKKDDSSHSTENMACMIAGRSGGLRPGHHIVAQDKHPVHVLNSAMKAVGVDHDLGEVVGTIPELFT